MSVLYNMLSFQLTAAAVLVFNRTVHPWVSLAGVLSVPVDRVVSVPKSQVSLWHDTYTTMAVAALFGAFFSVL